jgi:hypothetical protein
MAVAHVAAATELNGAGRSVLVVDNEPVITFTLGGV